jgi:hypothetical protein
MSYEIALGNNTDPPVSGHSEIYNKWVMLSFMSQRSMPLVDADSGIRLGFDYLFKQAAPLQDETVSQIIQISFDPGGITSTWANQPPACPSATTPDCYNDPTTDPSKWVSFKPGKVDLFQKIATASSDGNSTTWTGPTQWVIDHTNIWIFVDNSGKTPKYYWRINMALPLRTTLNDPVPNWTSPSVFFDPNAFVATDLAHGIQKYIPGFWGEMVTDATDSNTGIPNKIINHFPDWSTANEPFRDTNNVPAKLAWGQAEVGSPRDPALLNGDLQCPGQGLLVEGTAGDNYVWHSYIWNNFKSPDNNNNGNFADPAGTLYMYNKTTLQQAHNNMSVKLVNQGGGQPCVTDADCQGTHPSAIAGQCNAGFCSVRPGDVNANFLIAPYGSQAIATVWSPLNAGDATTKGGNDYTCINTGATATGNKTCTPLPKAFPAIDSQPHDATLQLLTQSKDAQWDMKQDWIPSPNYICATRETDNPGSYSWWYEEPTYQNAGQLCEKAVYTPDDRSGSIGGGIEAGLPGHQCMQVQLSGNGVQFAINSAFRNMHQAPASLHREPAVIDTKGLKKTGKGYHDVYLYVETRNMPYRVDTGYAPATYSSTMSEYTAINKRCTLPPVCDSGCIDANKTCQPGTANNACGINGNACQVCGQLQFCGEGGQCFNQIGARKGGQPTRAADRGECTGYDPNVPTPSDDFYAQRLPTVIFHTYADTGVTETINGKKIPILTPMTSFGQYITHD